MFQIKIKRLLTDEEFKEVVKLKELDRTGKKAKAYMDSLDLSYIIKK